MTICEAAQLMKDNTDKYRVCPKCGKESTGLSQITDDAIHLECKCGWKIKIKK